MSRELFICGLAFLMISAMPHMAKSSSHAPASEPMGDIIPDDLAREYGVPLGTRFSNPGGFKEMPPVDTEAVKSRQLADKMFSNSDDEKNKGATDD